MSTILLINPNTSVASLDMMLSVARPLLPPDVAIRGVCVAAGVPMITTEAALTAAAAEVAAIGVAESAGADAIVVAAFGDPGAALLRALGTLPVIGIGESAIREAAADGRRFGIATTTPGLVGAMERMVGRLSFAAQLTGVRVPDGDPQALAADPPSQQAALAEAATACIEQDGAAAVIIGGGPLSEAARALRGRFAVAMIEPVPAAIRQALRVLGKGETPC
jgi:Asp/Glu/hydantoin racemase